MADALREIAALQAFQPKPVNACGCIGPQNGQPRCPCAMRGVIIRNGRYVVPEQDLGPVCTPPAGDAQPHKVESA